MTTPTSQSSSSSSSPSTVTDTVRLMTSEPSTTVQELAISANDVEVEELTQDGEEDECICDYDQQPTRPRFVHMITLLRPPSRTGDEI